MRKVLGASLALTTLLLGASARADGPAALQCKTPDQLNCFVGDIFLLDGAGSACGPDSYDSCDRPCDPGAADQGKETCKTSSGEFPYLCDPISKTCRLPIVSCPPTNLDPEAENGCTNWNINYSNAYGKIQSLVGEVPETDQYVFWGTDFPLSVGPAFQRVAGQQKVYGIGLPFVSNPGQKFVGWITAGSTDAVDDEINEVYECAGLCGVLEGYSNLMDGLSSATAAMYGTYAKVSKDTATNQLFIGNLWNSFLDTRGSILGGNTWRNNGNGTFESSLPPVLRGVIPPFEGNFGLHFTPMDLYLLGFASPDEVPPFIFYDVTADAITKPRTATGDVPAGYGQGMGVVPGVQLRVKNADIKKIKLDDLVATMGARGPSYQDAPHSIRQFWVAVTLPGQRPKDEIVNETEMTKKDGALVKLVKWRRTFNWYFYMLTHWRGRMITTFEGNVDDSPYWEFSDSRDDDQAYQVGGGLEVSGSIDANAGNRALVIRTPGAEGTMTFKGHPYPIRVDSAVFNAFTIRMRIAPGAVPPGKAFASVSFPGGPTVRIPDTTGDTEKAFLIPDGLWHTYSANLSKKAGWTNQPAYDAFTVSPSSEAATDIQVDYVRVVNAENPEDMDQVCGLKEDREAEPDGWIDDYDNCPTVYNPGQEDGNFDGKGDACEDFDADGIPNRCDNCPTFTNSRQRDTDKDGIGDNCDDSPGDGSCLTPSRVGGQGDPGLLGLAFVVGLATLLTTRRRRSA